MVYDVQISLVNAVCVLINDKKFHLQKMSSILLIFSKAHK